MRYAASTRVSVAKSRGQIDALLRQWGAAGVQWTDEFDRDRIMLRFLWEYGGRRYMARLTLMVPDANQLRRRAIDGRSKSKVSPAKLEKLQRTRGQTEHRILLLWLKAAFNAVAAGIVTPQEVFLPFLEGRDGRTVSEVAESHVTQLLGNGYNTAGLLAG